MNCSAYAIAKHDSRQFALKAVGAAFLFTGAMVGAAPASAALTTATLYETPATAPSGAMWLNDAKGGHLWVSDHINGLCRLDANPAVPGTTVINTTTCYNFGAGGGAGQAAFDPLTNFVYVPDLSAKSQGITRLLFDPASGTMSPDSIVAPNSGISGDRPSAVALGPDRNIYVSFKKNGNIVKLTNPGCVDSATVSCSTLQQKVSVGQSSDGRRVMNMAFVGNDLYLAETNLLTRMRNAPLCTGGCQAFQTGAFISQPQSLAYDGKYLFVGDLVNVNRIAVLPGGNPGTPVVYASGFTFVSGLAVKQATPTSAGTGVFAAEDPTRGLTPLTGSWWTMPYVP